MTGEPDVTRENDDQALARFERLPVTVYPIDRIPLQPRTEQHTYREFIEARNALLDVLRNFGTVGPLAALPIEYVDLPPAEELDHWVMGSADPDYFVVDDWLFDDRRYLRVEVQHNRISVGMLYAIWSMLDREYPLWEVSVLWDDVHLIIDRDAVRASGSRVTGCRTMGDVCRRLAEAVGPSNGR